MQINEIRTVLAPLIDVNAPLWLYARQPEPRRRSKRKGVGHKQHARAQAKLNARRKRRAA
jgi:hypothetical protein